MLLYFCNDNIGLFYKGNCNTGLCAGDGIELDVDRENFDLLAHPRMWVKYIVCIIISGHGSFSQVLRLAPLSFAIMDFFNSH